MSIPCGSKSERNYKNYTITKRKCRVKKKEYCIFLSDAIIKQNIARTIKKEPPTCLSGALTPLHRFNLTALGKTLVFSPFSFNSITIILMDN
jgi:hypothetical protein